MIRKQFLAVALCLLMVSAFAVTGAASAASASKPYIQQFDLKNIDPDSTDHMAVFGKLTVNYDTGRYVVNIEWNRYSDYGKELFKYNPGKTGFIRASNPDAPDLEFGSVEIDNGGNIHGSGTLDKTTLDWLGMWGNNPDTTYGVVIPGLVIP